MLDYSVIAKAYEGVVVFSPAAARYVPSRSGLYQIIPTPYSFSEVEREDAYTNYFSSRRQYLLDLKRPMSSALELSRKHLQIAVQQPDEPLRLDASQAESFETLRALCTFFPPIYVGQAIGLRERFLDHTQGRHSEVQSELERLGLEKNLSFFRWFETPESRLTYLENILIKASSPDLNTQSR